MIRNLNLPSPIALLLLGLSLSATACADREVRSKKNDNSADPAVVEMLEVLGATSLGDGALDGPFLMPVTDVFSIAGRGTTVSGQIERGTVRVGDEVAIVGIRDTVKTTVTSIEKPRELPDVARAGDTVGVLLPGIERSNVEPGQVLAKPGSIAAHTRFSARIYLLSGRDVTALPELRNLSGDQVLKQGDRPQFYFRTAEVPGTVELLANAATLAPGAPADIRVTLKAPIAMEPGTRFKIMEGGRTIGVGMVAGTTD